MVASEICKVFMVAHFPKKGISIKWCLVAINLTSFLVLIVNKMASYKSSSLGVKLVSSHQSLSKVLPLIVSALFGNASIILPFGRLILVL